MFLLKSQIIFNAKVLSSLTLTKLYFDVLFDVALIELLQVHLYRIQISFILVS